MQIVANGTDPAPDAEVPAAGQDSTEPRLLVFGRLATHKRVDLVLRAVAELVDELPELRVDVVGKGPEEERLRSLVEELGLGDVVVLHGFLPDADKQAMLHRSRLQVCASDAEGWGQVVIEAATYGVPTLARDVPGLQDSIRPGRTGWLVPDNAANPDAVTRSLVTGIRAALEELATPACASGTARRVARGASSSAGATCVARSRRSSRRSSAGQVDDQVGAVVVRRTRAPSAAASAAGTRPAPTGRTPVPDAP